MAKIIVSDFDDTLYTMDFLRNIEIVQNFVQKGNYFILATEESYPKIWSEIENFHIPFSFLIGEDGATIHDFHGNLIMQKYMDPIQANHIFQYLQKQKAFYEIWYDNGKDYVTHIENGVYKIIAKPKKYKKMEEIIAKCEKLYPDFRFLMVDHWLQITDKKSTKANAIDYLLHEYQMDENQVYVVGDQANDVEMIERFHGFIMDKNSKNLRINGATTIHNFDEMIQNMSDM